MTTGRPPSDSGEEWEIFDLDVPARNVSFVEGTERVSGAMASLVTHMGSFSKHVGFVALPLLLILGEISSGQFVLCFALQCAVSGGPSLARDSYIQSVLSRMGRDALSLVQRPNDNDNDNTDQEPT